MTAAQAAMLAERFDETRSEWRHLAGEAALRAFLVEAGQADAAHSSPPFSAVREGETAFTLADGLIAETGTLLLSGRLPGARRAAFLAETHFALVAEEDVFDTLADFIAAEARPWRERVGATLTLIAGPSRTADIEKVIVLGAHGPRRLVVATAPRAVIAGCFMEADP
jgi:L-lactate dehydrogenase complex protein LldG